MKIFVPDASVILKWVLGEEEEGKESALALLHGWLHQEHEFVLPSLWVYEVGNVLGIKRPREAARILNLLLSYELRECPLTERLINLAFDLMKESKGITFYDAIYHAVAFHEKGLLITADQAYFNKVKDKKGIRLIGD